MTQAKELVERTRKTHCQSVATRYRTVIFCRCGRRLLVGVDSHSDYPPEVARLPVVGSHERLNLEDHSGTQT